MFLLYDYTFLPEGATTKAEGLAIARERNIVGTDEFLLSSEPYATRDAWCRDRVAATRKRLEDLDWMTPTVLVNHFPMVREPCDAMFYPEFSLWCGTTATADWHTRYNAICSVYGHLHIPRTTWYDGVRFEEVSVGYPREWRRRKPYRWLRQILPDPKYAPGYLNDFGGHFEITAGDAGARAAVPRADLRQRQRDDADARCCPAVLPGIADWRAAELYSDPPELAPLPEEEPLIARSVAKRRNEFITVRYCARQALGELGFAAGADPQGGQGRTMLARRRGRQPDALRGLPRRRGRSGGRGPLGGHRRRTARRAAQRRARRDQPARRARRAGRAARRRALGPNPVLRQGGDLQGVVPADQRWLGFEDAHITFAVDGAGCDGQFESTDPDRRRDAVGPAAERADAGGGRCDGTWC